MVSTAVDAVWVWPYGRTAFRAAYGRVGGAFTHDFLQTSRNCSRTFESQFGPVGEGRYPITWTWPGGSVEGLVKAGGDYAPPGNLRLNFRWPTSRAPAPWKLFPRPGELAAFPGDPTKPWAAEANQELARFEAGNYDPWIMAIKLAGEDHVLHARAYMGRPPTARAYASTASLPAALRELMESVPAGGCGAWEAKATSVTLWFDPERVFAAWEHPTSFADATQVFALVLNTDGRATASDVPGVSYSYPVRNRGLVVPGRPVAYFRGATKSDEPGYFGTALVGEVSSRSSHPGFAECRIEDYRVFERLVPYRVADGRYLEPDGANPGYFRRRLRVIPIDALEEILSLATLVDNEAAGVATADEAADRKYATSDLARRIDAYAMEAALAEVKRRFPGCLVKRMPHNNPGYDIKVTRDGLVVRYVEVKGTGGPMGAFFISEGERQHSAREADRYSLCVVLEIDTDARTHRISWHDGEVDSERFALRVRQWQGQAPIR